MYLITKCKFIFYFHLWLLLGVYSQNITDPSTVEIGDEVCFEGYIMDNYCIELGYLLDNFSAETLREPEKHSVHCLVDVGRCVQSNFEILQDPREGEDLYTRAFQVIGDDKSKLITLARSVGTSCSTCTGDGNLRKGFRAEVRGVVVEDRNGDIPPTLQLTEVTHSNDLTVICGETVIKQTNSGNNDDNGDLAVKVVSGLAVAAMAIVALLSMFGLLQKPQQKK